MCVDTKSAINHCTLEFLQSLIMFFFFLNISTKLSQGHTGRIAILGLFRTDLAALSSYCQDLELIFSQCGPCAWLIRCNVIFQNQKANRKKVTYMYHLILFSHDGWRLEKMSTL